MNQTKCRRKRKCSVCGKTRLCSLVPLATNGLAKTVEEACFKPFPLCADCENKTGEWEP